MAHLTREEVLRSGEVSPEYRKAFEARPCNIFGRDFFAHRAARAEHLSKLRHLYLIPAPIPDKVTETMHNVPTRDGSSIRVRVYQPVIGPPEGRSPLIMMYHEGGWSMGDLTDEDLNCRLFARELGAVCVNVEYRSASHVVNLHTMLSYYRLAPEYPFPVGVNDCWDALKWALSMSPYLHATPQRGLIVGGSSAGGNISAIMALLSRDEHLDPPITGQYLSVPALLPSDRVPSHLTPLYQSRSTSTSDPVLGKLNDSGILSIYAPDPNSPLWDPFNHPDGHKGVAKTFFQVGGLDPLRDEAVLYDRKLRESGVLTRFELYAGYGHMFWTNWPELERSEEFVKDTVRGVKWLLEA
ncbi:alpha/beta-hydrolase [Melanomma pulvis-pyrius CBS 109.77]|uniref:Alpha/beta-hydrolase n=1 Tax=Melanomma pulvis-pyrius CBS 109.77 TaxID=1314802 RepID=A0A6A6WUR9_9PLEO|nr:alpha/beta-hydrolase [Melanomma pulvis-pyrius CBS 109.77]